MNPGKVFLSVWIVVKGVLFVSVTFGSFLAISNVKQVAVRPSESSFTYKFTIDCGTNLTLTQQLRDVMHNLNGVDEFAYVKGCQFTNGDLPTTESQQWYRDAEFVSYAWWMTLLVSGVSAVTFVCTPNKHVQALWVFGICSVVMMPAIISVTARYLAVQDDMALCQPVGGVILQLDSQYCDIPLPTQGWVTWAEDYVIPSCERWYTVGDDQGKLHLRVRPVSSDTVRDALQQARSSMTAWLIAASVCLVMNTVGSGVMVCVAFCIESAFWKPNQVAVSV